MGRRRRSDGDGFDTFFADAEPRLRRALVASFGPSTGRAAAVDALSWGWEHWSRLSSMSNPVGYLFRVGQTAARRYESNRIPIEPDGNGPAEPPPFEPALWPSLAQLPEQQRIVALLVHGYGWSQVDVAEMLDVNASTVHAHSRRALVRLRSLLESNHA